MALALQTRDLERRADGHARIAGIHGNERALVEARLRHHAC